MNNSEEPIKVKPTPVEPKVKAKPKRASTVSYLLNVVLVVVLLILVIPALVNRVQDTTNQPQPVEKTTFSQATVDKNRQSLPDDAISKLVEKVSPSVVSIVTSSTTDSVFGQGSERSGAGSGVILSSNGYILTNKHVVNNATKLTVITSDGETYDAEVIYKDPLNDLAFIKVNNPKNFRPIEIGDSKTVKTGQPVIAIGNSLGQYQNTVTRGIISGVGRNIVAQGQNRRAESLTDMLQTDAAINPGNSGGPLVNAGGQLIGINTAISQGANNTGFAIPVGAAKGLIKQLANGQKLQRAILGIRYIALNPAIAKTQNLSEKQGALIQGEVIANSAAAKAGLKSGDIITKINNHTIGKDGGLSTLLSEYSVGDEINLQVKRDGKVLNFKVKLQAASDITTANSSESPTGDN